MINLEIGDEVFRLRSQWRLVFNGKVPVTTWSQKGAAEAQLELLKKRYSEIGEDGIIRHVGAKKTA